MRDSTNNSLIQASCTAGRASFMTGRFPIRSALSIVVAPGDENFLRKETPTIAEFFQKNGYTTYFSGNWQIGRISCDARLLLSVPEFVVRTWVVA